MKTNTKKKYTPVCAKHPFLAPQRRRQCSCSIQQKKSKSQNQNQNQKSKGKTFNQLQPVSS